MRLLVRIVMLATLLVASALCQDRMPDARPESTPGAEAVKTPNTIDERSSNIRNNQPNGQTQSVEPTSGVSRGSTSLPQDPTPNLSLAVAILTGLTAVFTFLIILAALFGWREIVKVRAMRKWAEASLERSNTVAAKAEAIVLRNEEPLKKFVRDKVKNQLNFALVDLTIRIENYKLAFEILREIDVTGEEGEFEFKVRLLEGKIKFGTKDYEGSRQIFTDLIKSPKADFLIFDMLGASNRRLFKGIAKEKRTEADEELVVAAITAFTTGLKHVDEANIYDQLRLLSNIQTCYSLLSSNKAYKKVVKTFDARIREYFPYVPVDEKYEKSQIDALNMAIFVHTANSYWRLEAYDELYEISRVMIEKLELKDIYALKEKLTSAKRFDLSEIDSIIDKYIALHALSGQ